MLSVNWLDSSAPTCVPYVEYHLVIAAQAPRDSVPGPAPRNQKNSTESQGRTPGWQAKVEVLQAIEVQLEATPD